MYYYNKWIKVVAYWNVKFYYTIYKTIPQKIKVVAYWNVKVH